MKQSKRRWSGIYVNLGMMVVPVTGPPSLYRPTVEDNGPGMSAGSLLKIGLNFLASRLRLSSHLRSTQRLVRSVRSAVVPHWSR